MLNIFDNSWIEDERLDWVLSDRSSIPDTFSIDNCSTLSSDVWFFDVPIVSVVNTGVTVVGLVTCFVSAAGLLAPDNSDETGGSNDAVVVAVINGNSFGLLERNWGSNWGVSDRVPSVKLIPANNRKKLAIIGTHLVSRIIYYFLLNNTKWYLNKQITKINFLIFKSW